MKATESAPGLGSLQGIRWLLAVGALTMAVSVYRLVESQWAGMSVTAQFLTLVTGSLVLFGVGELLRNRLRLPIAGSALQLLFTVLVPVLSWGAAYLNLMSTAWGAAVYGFSVVALLAAFRRCLRETLRYEGVAYPLAFSLFTISLPLMSFVTPSSSGFIAAALALGAVFHFGARHINRFLFHRDQRDGIDRPVHVLPFLALAVLYVASLSVLQLPVSFVALPILVLGVALVTTGEEYYAALMRSRRARPASWPRRSVALLSLGFALMAIAAPLSFLDGAGRVVAIVFISIATVLFRWSFRYQNGSARVAAMLASVVGYFCLPTLLPTVVTEPIFSLSAWLGLENPYAAIAFSQLGLGVIFTLLARDKIRVHAIVATVHLTVIVAVSAVSGAWIIAPLALGLALISTWLTRRPDWLVAAHAALGASILAWGGTYNIELLAGVLIAGVVAYRPYLAYLGPQWKNYLLLPPMFWAFVVVGSGMMDFTNGGALEIVLASVLFMALGQRFAFPASILLGLFAMSVGIHGELAFAFDASHSVLVLATMAMFVLSVLGWRRANRTWELGLHVSILGHGALGIAWLFLAFVNGPMGPFSFEPFIVALFGWAVLSHGIRSEDATDANVGLAFLVAYVPFHLWAAAWSSSVPILLLAALLVLLAARFVPIPILEKPVARFILFWRAAAVVAALTMTGTEMLALAVVIILMAPGAFAGKAPYRGGLLVAAHTLVLVEGVSASFFPLALVEAAAAAFPLASALALAWILLVEVRGPKTLVPWTACLEAMVLLGFFALPFSLYTAWDFAALIAVGFAFALRHGVNSYRSESTGYAWMMQLWLGVNVLVGIDAGWITFGNGRAPYVLLASGLVQYALAGFFAREPKALALASSSRASGNLLAFLGGMVGLVRMQAIPLFLVSVFYLILASRGEKRVVPSVLSAGFLGFGLVAIAWGHGVGMEFYSLAPGFSLVALSLLLSKEMGPRWSRHLFTAGAAFIYATPVLALYDDITWAWQAVLLMLTVGFGATSFWLRSRPLLTVSTAALVIDLACFVIKIRATEPVLLWVGGVMLGIALMSLAAYLEYRREGLAQQIRVFGQELAHWY